MKFTSTTSTTSGWHVGMPILIYPLCLIFLPFLSMSGMSSEIIQNLSNYISYFSDYYLKPDNKMLEFLVAALKEHQDLSLHEKLKLMKDTFLTHRQIGNDVFHINLVNIIFIID